MCCRISCFWKLHFNLSNMIHHVYPLSFCIVTVSVCASTGLHVRWWDYNMYRKVGFLAGVCAIGWSRCFIFSCCWKQCFCMWLKFWTCVLHLSSLKRSPFQRQTILGDRVSTSCHLGACVSANVVDQAGDFFSIVVFMMILFFCVCLFEDE